MLKQPFLFDIFPFSVFMKGCEGCEGGKYVQKLFKLVKTGLSRGFLKGKANFLP